MDPTELNQKNEEKLMNQIKVKKWGYNMVEKDIREKKTKNGHLGIFKKNSSHTQCRCAYRRGL